MFALLLIMAVEAPAGGERLLAHASARILRGETIALASGGGTPGRQRNRVVRTNEKTGARETLTLTEFQ